LRGRTFWSQHEGQCDHRHQHENDNDAFHD
jgi:hypothetical protein